jgi:hypothetical protein
MEVDWHKRIGTEDFTALVFDWQSLVQVAVVVAAVTLVVICIMALRHQRRIEKRWEQSMQELTACLSSLSITTSKVDERLSSVETDTANLMEEQRALEASAPTKDNVRHAITLVERGWKANDLVDACGLTRTEADLVCLLHGAGTKKQNGLHA